MGSLAIDLGVETFAELIAQTHHVGCHVLVLTWGEHRHILSFANVVGSTDGKAHNVTYTYADGNNQWVTGQRLKDIVELVRPGKRGAVRAASVWVVPNTVSLAGYNLFPSSGHGMTTLADFIKHMNKTGYTDWVRDNNAEFDTSLAVPWSTNPGARQLYAPPTDEDEMQQQQQHEDGQPPAAGVGVAQQHEDGQPPAAGVGVAQQDEDGQQLLPAAVVQQQQHNDDDAAGASDRVVRRRSERMHRQPCFYK